MADAPEIKVKLTAEDTGVSAAIKELGAQLKTLKKSQDETAASAFNLAGAFKAIVAGAAGLGFLRIGQEAFQSATNIGKLSDKTGISTQTLSVFNKVAENVGASTESVDKSLIKAAKSITEFQQGSTKAAGGFKLLNLTAQDFAGLNADQKLQLVVAKLGAMEKGFQKATATSQIFGKGASDLTLVANSLAAQGFDKATESTAKLGLLLDQTTTDDFRAAAASMQELQDVGKGIATQFEAGMLPAISDVGEALVDSMTQGGVSFKTLGQYAGDVIRSIALVFIGFGQTVGTVIESIYDAFSQLWKEIKNEGTTTFRALGDAVHGNFTQAVNEMLAGQKRSAENISETIQRQKAIYGALADSFKSDYNNLFPSAEEEEKRRKARIAKLRPDKQVEAPEPGPPPAPNDAAAKARLALLEKQVQDELELHRAQAAQQAEIDKELYDKGEITLKEYYARRRAEITAASAEETAILQRGLAAAQEEVARTTAAASAEGQSPKEKDRSEAARLNSLAKVDELQTKIATTQLKATTDQKKLDDEEFKAKQTNNAALLEFEKEIDTSAAKRKEAAAAEIELEKQKLSVILAQSGASKEQIAAELQRFATAKANAAAFADEQAAGQAALKELADEKAAVEQKVQSGQLFSIQGQEQIRQIEAARLPVLQQIAAAMLEQAKATGDESKIAQAEDFSKQVAAIQVQANLAGQQVAQLKQGLESSLVGGFTQFFDTVGRGTESVAQSFKNLAGSIIGSLAKMTAQMLAQIVVAKLLKLALGGTGFSGGGAVPAGQGLADGGLIKGPGGPKADAIPARLSAGEFVVKADAVASFGAHNLEAINRGLKVPSFENLALPKFADGGLVGQATGAGSSGSINLGIGLDEGLILKHLSSKQAGRIVLDHITSNPKAASKALGRSQG
jgi:hypothetical protein